MNCPIWGTPSQEIDQGDGYDGARVDSARSGGRYAITGSALAQIETLNQDQKKLLTSWLIEQRRSGSQVPEITSDILVTIRNKKPLRYTERVNRALQAIETNIAKIGQRLSLTDRDPSLVLRIVAETECADGRELMGLLGLIEDAGLLDINRHSNGAEVRPTAAGWQRIEQLQSTVTNSVQAFVAMWFDHSMATAYEAGFRPAVEDAGYRPLRIDNKEHINRIDDEIIAEIRRSRFVVADFTSPPKMVRGGVYYEAGFARALGIPVVSTCHKDSIEDLHFDTRQYNHLIWDEPLDLRKQLSNRISALLGDGPLRGNN